MLNWKSVRPLHWVVRLGLCVACASPACAAGGAPADAYTGSSAPIPIVYSWSERTQGEFELKGHRMTALDNYDPLPDVKFVYSGFKEANVVDRDANGNEKTLFDCIGNNQLHCAALDPRVSPDNRRIAFAVLYGKAVTEGRWTIHGVLPIPVLNGVHTGQIFVFDTVTGKLSGWPRVEGVIDMHPEWINNDELVFVSTRSKVFPVRMFGKSPSYGGHHALQRWRGHADGSNAINIGPHDDVALHPLVLSDGNILTATWRVDENLHAGVTPENQYWMSLTDQFGGNETSLLGAHGTLFRQGGVTNSLVALHFYGELSNGDIATSNYYRGRHLGLGMPIAFPRLPHGVEGTGGGFLPAIYSLLPWAQEEDNPTHRDRHGRFMGKGGYPVGLPNGQVLLTKGTGYCYEGLTPDKANAEYLGGSGCDTGIYVLKSVPSAHPDDLVRVVDQPDRHEFSADVRLPYQAVYGRPMPAVQKRIDQGDCSLGIVNVHLTKLHGGGPACTKKGACIEAGYSIANLDRLAIYRAEPNRERQRSLRNFPREGQDMTLLGYVRPEADGSVNVHIPCDMPYKLRGVSRDGVEFIRDQVKHSNRPGEHRQCLGCHAGHTMDDYKPDVPGLFARTIAGSKKAVDLNAD
ncbi:MAG: hypothetical protein M0P63_05955 [Azoarcus sp.]|nr:hypothetical protein [Azoarcus sp.]